MVSLCIARAEVYLEEQRQRRILAEKENQLLEKQRIKEEKLMVEKEAREQRQWKRKSQAAIIPDYQPPEDQSVSKSEESPLKIRIINDEGTKISENESLHLPQQSSIVWNSTNHNRFGPDQKHNTHHASVQATST